MEYYKIGNYEQRIEKGEPVCLCRWGSLYPYAYNRGEKICHHIVELMKQLYNSYIKPKPLLSKDSSYN